MRSSPGGRPDHVSTVDRRVSVTAPEAIADRMLDLERYFRENRASRVTVDVKQVTGHDPRRFADYARETAATGVWNADVVQSAS